MKTGYIYNIAQGWEIKEIRTDWLWYSTGMIEGLNRQMERIKVGLKDYEKPIQLKALQRANDRRESSDGLDITISSGSWRLRLPFEKLQPSEKQILSLVNSQSIS